jgi:hypothetical protein
MAQHTDLLCLFFRLGLFFCTTLRFLSLCLCKPSAGARLVFALRLSCFLLFLFDALDPGVCRNGNVHNIADASNILLLATRAFGFILLFCVSLVVTAMGNINEL